MNTKSVIFGLLTTVSFSSFGQVFLRFDNQTAKIISIHVLTGNQASPITSYTEIYSTTIPANANPPESPKIKNVKKGDNIVVEGTAVGMTGTFKFFQQTIYDKNLHFTVPLTLNNVETLPSDNTSYQNLIDALNYSPPSKSEKVMSSDVAFKSFFGGLFLKKDSSVIDRLEPTVLKAEMNPIQYGSINRTIDLYLSGSFLTSTKAAAPGIASVSATAQSDELYKLSYSVNDIGTLVWSPPNGKSIAQLFNELDEVDKEGWVKRYIADTTLRMCQYDNIYLFKTMTISVDRLKRTSTVIDASVPVFFSNNTSFKKEDGESFNINATTTALNVWSSKDVTYLLVQAARDYLEKQKVAVQNATTNQDAENLINSTLKLNNTSLLKTPTNATKTEIVTKLNGLISNYQAKVSDGTQLE